MKIKFVCLMIAAAGVALVFAHAPIAAAASANEAVVISDTVPPEFEEALAQVREVKEAQREASNASALEELSKATPEVPVRVIVVGENQPVHIVDAQGRLVQILYLKRK